MEVVKNLKQIFFRKVMIFDIDEKKHQQSMKNNNKKEN